MNVQSVYPEVDVISCSIGSQQTIIYEFLKEFLIIPLFSTNESEIRDSADSHIKIYDLAYNIQKYLNCSARNIFNFAISELPILYYIPRRMCRAYWVNNHSMSSLFNNTQPTELNIILFPMRLIYNLSSLINQPLAKYR